MADFDELKNKAEGAAGQANRFHQPGHAGAGKTSPLGQRAAAGQQPFAGLLFVFIGVAHSHASAGGLDDDRDLNIAFVY